MLEFFECEKVVNQRNNLERTDEIHGNFISVVWWDVHKHLYRQQFFSIKVSIHFRKTWYADKYSCWQISPCEMYFVLFEPQTLLMMKLAACCASCSAEEIFWI